MYLQSLHFREKYFSILAKPLPALRTIKTEESGQVIFLARLFVLIGGFIDVRKILVFGSARA
ncbi:hypothetical protein [Exilibacterium tricleocarpae]|uniref:hypothetical protein n=1 Tax=Exilibacterium tricleocarpae TaxID=2591008 RepID=UPI00115D0D76|nr:hypothetical protein [Exilibacterium tricleocarpae]